MTTQEIYNQIIAKKTNYSELDNLNSTSNVSIWRLWAFIFAFFSKSIDELFETFKTYIESVFAKNQAGTLQWWLNKIKEFQLNDELFVVDGVFKYNLIDVSKQIIVQVALEVENRILVFKCVKSVDDVLTPLTSSEITSLTAYINKIKFPGTFIQILSQKADDLRLSYRIYYDALLDKTNIETEINATILNYLNNIIFNGKFIITELTDLLQNISGVTNPVYLNGQVKNHFQTEDEYSEIADFATAKAGYFILNTLTLEFIAE